MCRRRHTGRGKTANRNKLELEKLALKLPILTRPSSIRPRMPRHAPEILGA